MATFDKKEVQARVEAKVRAGDFFFPEDLARAIAKELGVELEGTPFGQDKPSESKTRGSVPPFSGMPASEDAATDTTKTSLKEFEKVEAKRAEKDNRVRLTAEGMKTTPEDLGLDDKVSDGPIYPDDASTSTDVTSADANDKKKSNKK